jgi:hypothetical protein
LGDERSHIAHTSQMDGYIAAKRKVPLKFKILNGFVRIRRPALVVALTLCSGGLYGLYWLYRTSAELCGSLREDEEIRPALELLLTVCTLGLYGFWTLLRNARKVHTASLYFRRNHTDLSHALGWLFFFAPFTLGITFLVAIAKVQAQLNEFAELAAMRDRARSAGAVSTPSLERRVLLVPATSSRRLPTEQESDDPSSPLPALADARESPLPVVSPEASAARDGSLKRASTLSNKQRL